MFCDAYNVKLFSGRLPVSWVFKTINDQQSTLLAELLRSFLDKLGKRKEERGKPKLKKVLSVTKHGFVF